MDVIQKYGPKQLGTGKDTMLSPNSWDRMFVRVVRHNDDGYAASLFRAFAHGRNICAAYDMYDPLYRIQGDMWLQLGHMRKLP